MKRSLVSIRIVVTTQARSDDNTLSSDRNVGSLILAKARHGDTGKIELWVDKSCGMIDSLKADAKN